MNTQYEQYESLVPKYIAAISSTAHTYGNVLATIEKKILGFFDEGLFNTIVVASQIAHSQIVRTPQKHIKKARPMITFSPRVEYGEESFMKGTLLASKRGGLHTTGTHGVTDLCPFFKDPNTGASMYFSETTRVMYVDVLITFDTTIEQLNYMDYLLAELDWDTPFDIEAWLEHYLSPNLLEVLGNICGVPVYDESDGSVTDFLNYMNSHSAYPVTYKLAGETGKDEFYRYYRTKILATLSNLDKGDGEAVGHVMANYTVRFSMKLELWIPSMLYLFSDKVPDRKHAEIPTDSTLIPIFADMFVAADLNLAEGWEVYGHASYILEKAHDSISFTNLIQNGVKNAIMYCINKNLPYTDLIDVKVRCMGELLQEEIDYTLNMPSYEVQLNNSEYGTFTYTVIVTINTWRMNELTKEVYGLE